MGLKTIIVADRPGWAIDKLMKPLSERLSNVDISYVNTKEHRFLATGYSDKGGIQFLPELGNQYDIIHFNCYRSASIIINRINKGIKKILTIQTERDDFLKYDLSLYDNIICPTEYIYSILKEKYTALFDKKTVNGLVKIPHCVDIDRYKYTEERPKTIGYVGRVVSWKRYDVVQRQALKAGFKMIGCGYIEDSNIYKKNQFKEGSDYDYYIFYPDDKMNEFYSKIGILCSISEPHIETGPLPVLEAMACGVPVISTRVGWAKDNCEHLKNIYFIDDSEVNNLSEIIKKLYSDKDLMVKLSSNAYELVKNFTMEQYAKRHLSLYKGE